MPVSPAPSSEVEFPDGQGRSDEAGSTAGEPARTILCFSNLRWDGVLQRPQHLMTRLATSSRVIFWEAPRHIGPGVIATLEVRRCPDSGVTVMTPLLSSELRADVVRETLKRLLDAEVACLRGPVQRWYYTPMMLPFSEHVAAECVVYDYMDRSVDFWHAPAELQALEQRLLDEADLVFTGGNSQDAARLAHHANLHHVPSGVDVAHFARARDEGEIPPDQADIPGPRFGFFGVIDERMDLDLIAALADARPDHALVMVGPIARIDPETLPRRANLHYLGRRGYAELPDYLRGWDVALVPFSMNAATRFISPSKIPGYLAAGRPVVTTPIAEVARTYGGLAGVWVADSTAAFIAACDGALAQSRDPARWQAQADRLLAEASWDRIFAQVQAVVAQAIDDRRQVRSASAAAPRSALPARYDVMVVGAGFAGAVMAERLARGSGKRVLVVDRRSHVGGNAFDRLDANGIRIHHYGPHVFHTNSREVVDYLSRFTKWRPFEHRVLADVEGKRVPMPVNRTTLNRLYDLDMQTDREASNFLAARAAQASADGPALHEQLVRDLRRKQWGVDPSELDPLELDPAELHKAARAPIRTSTDDRYFTDSFQAMPSDGYTRMFERMLDHPNIDVLLDTDFEEARHAHPHAHLVFTGTIDGYFGHCYGVLPYRSAEIRHETIDREWFQEAPVVEYPGETVPYTRITEYKFLTGQVGPRTCISYELPKAQGEPYYPIPRAENRALFQRYEALAQASPDVTFVGRLASYRDYQMDQVVAQALASYRRMRAAMASAPEATRSALRAG
jgi:UDP-galactopyranose mutase